MVEIKLLQPDQWLLHKQIRCQALADAPYAFSTTLAEALQRTDEVWVVLTQQRATDLNSITFFAYVGDKPCGMASCVCRKSDDEREIEPEAELLAVWVDPAYRQHKVGTALIEYARDWAKARGAGTLLAGVFEANQSALAFYQAIGFVDRGRQKADPAIRLLEMDLT